MQYEHTSREHRLIHRGFGHRNAPRQSSGSNERVESQEKKDTNDKRYKRGDALQEYVWKTHQTLDKKFDKLTTALAKKVGKREGAQKYLTYKDQLQKNISTYMESRNRDSAVLEKTFADAEAMLTQLEADIIKEGGIVERRYEDFAKEWSVDQIVYNGLVAPKDPRRPGVCLVDLPRDWKVSGITPVPISPNADPSETSHGVSGARQRIYFDTRGMEKMTVAFNMGGLDVSFGLPAEKQSDGSMKFVTNQLVTALENWKKGQEVRKEAAVQVMEDAANETKKNEQEFDSQGRTPQEVKDRVPAKQQSSETAAEVYESTFDELLALYKAWEAGAIPEKEYRSRKQVLEKKMDDGAQRIVRLMVEEAVRMKREGDPQLGENMEVIQKMFADVFGKGPEAKKRFEAHPLNKQQLERKDLPYTLKFDENGKLTFEENVEQRDRNTGEMVDERDTRYNQRLAYQLLNFALRGKGDVSMKERVQTMMKNDNITEEAALGQDTVRLLKGDYKQIGKEYGVYLHNGDLYEWDDTLIGTDEVLIGNFENMLMNNPVQALQELAALRLKNVADAKKAREMTGRADFAKNRFESERRLTRDEAKAILHSIGQNVANLRDMARLGTINQQDFTQVNQLIQRLAKGVDYPERIGNLLQAEKLIGHIEGTRLSLSYNAATHEVAVEEIG